MKRLLPVFLLGLLFLTARLSAQSPAVATISGTILDPSGAAVPGAKVTLQRKGAVAHTMSGAEGRYEISAAAGSYRLLVTHASFAVFEQELTVAAGEHLDVPVRLALDRASSQVVVTAEPFPAPRQTVAAPVDIVTEQDISQREANTVPEVLGVLPGVSFGQTSRIGGVTSFFLDGGNSNYTKVLVDGAPINAPGGAVDFSPFSLDNISKIEVVHGAESALYGSDAMAGVVQIFTSRGQTAVPQLDLVGEGGSFHSARGSATLSGLAGPFDYSAGYARYDTEGQGVNNDFRNQSFSGNVGWQFSPLNAVRLALRDNTSEAGVQGQILLTPPDLNEYSSLHDFTSALTGDFATGEHWRHHVGVTETFLRQDFNNPLSSYFLDPDPFDSCTGMPRSPKAVPSDFCDFTFSAHNSFNRVDIDAQTSYLGRNGSVTAGYFYEIENGYLSDIGSHARRNNQAGYLEARYQFFNRLTATAGVRAEDNDSFGTRVVPRVGLAFLARKGDDTFGATRLRFTYGQGIKEPSLDQSFGTDPCFPGNPNLNPERSNSTHGGVEQSFFADRLRVSLDGFYNRFHDMISFGEAMLPGCGFAGTYFNTDLARAAGVNVNIEAKPARWLRIVAGYAYDDSLVIKAPNATDPATIAGNRLLRRPLNSGSITVNAAYRRVNFNVVGYYSGSRTDSDFLFLFLTPRTPAYARFDIAGSYNVGHGVELFGRVLNLFDRDYQLALGFPGSGREFRGGIKYRIGGRS